ESRSEMGFRPGHLPGAGIRALNDCGTQGKSGTCKIAGAILHVPDFPDGQNAKTLGFTEARTKPSRGQRPVTYSDDKQRDELPHFGNEVFHIYFSRIARRRMVTLVPDISHPLYFAPLRRLEYALIPQ